jgi:hypothetical protein
VIGNRQYNIPHSHIRTMHLHGINYSSKKVFSESEKAEVTHHSARSECVI